MFHIFLFVIAISYLFNTQGLDNKEDFFTYFSEYKIHMTPNEEVYKKLQNGDSTLVSMDYLLITSPLELDSEKYQVVIEFFDNTDSKSIGSGLNELRIRSKYTYHHHEYFVRLKCLNNNSIPCDFTFVVQRGIIILIMPGETKEMDITGHLYINFLNFPEIDKKSTTFLLARRGSGEVRGDMK